MFSEDQEQFREVIARFLQDKSQVTATRKLLDTATGFDADTWQQLSAEVGVCGTHVPEAYGGFGFGPVELGIAAEEMGRYLYMGPFFASAVMATYALLELADESARDTFLPELASGAMIGTLVLDSLNGPEQLGHSLAASGNTLTGSAALVIDAQAASRLFVIATSGENLSLYTTAANAAGVSINPIESLDPTRRLAEVNFDNAEVELLGQADPAALTRLWEHLSVALAHEMIGGAQHLLNSTVEYTKIRYQFGRPIGSFQGLKHRCADLLMEVEWAKAVTHKAAEYLATGEGDAELPYMAKAMSADVYMKAAKEAIQMRGGIGFTWEEDTHFWYKRAKSSEVFLGTPTYHRERMMQIVEQQAGASA